jgi:hypothetical protein
VGPTTITRFRWPEYDSRGRLKSEVSGDRADVRPDGRVRVVNLRIDVYRDGAPDVSVWADECVFDRRDRSATTDGEVRFKRGEMEGRGVGLRWDPVAQRLVILDGVRLSIGNVRLWMKQHEKQRR